MTPRSTPAPHLCITDGKVKELSQLYFIKAFLIPQGGSSWGSADQQSTALAILSGAASGEELRYLKSTSLQLWLFGYELPGDCCACCAMQTTPASCPMQEGQNTPGLLLFTALTFLLAETVIVITKKAFHVLTSAKKGAHPLHPHAPPFTWHLALLLRRSGLSCSSPVQRSGKRPTYWWSTVSQRRAHREVTELWWRVWQLRWWWRMRRRARSGLGWTWWRM